MKASTQGAMAAAMKNRKLNSKKPAVVYTVPKRIMLTPDMAKVLKYVRSVGTSSTNNQDQPSIFA
jgi:hypothetical protein